jgi:hypothetical protein
VTRLIGADGAMAQHLGVALHSDAKADEMITAARIATLLLAGLAANLRHRR